MRISSFNPVRILFSFAALGVMLALPSPLFARHTHVRKAAQKTSATHGTITHARKTSRSKPVARMRPRSAKQAHSTRAAGKRTARHKAAPATEHAAAAQMTADPATAARIHAWEHQQHSTSKDAQGSPTAAVAPVATQQPQEQQTADAPADAARGTSDLTRYTAAAELKPTGDLSDAAATGVAQPPESDSTGSQREPAQRRKTPLGEKPTQQSKSSLAAKQTSSEQPTADTAPSSANSIMDAPAPKIIPVLYTRRGRLIVPPALKGSHEILVHQNTVADREGLDRVQDDDDLIHMRRSKQLVALPISNSLGVDERLPVDRRYCRPWTAKFLLDIGRAHYARFHSRLQVNSAVRTVAFQKNLRRTNGNAAPIDGDTASPHLTGATVDLAKHGLSMTEIAWMRGYLLPLEQEGKIDVEEEFQQSVFHISVYKSYAPAPQQKRTAPGQSAPARPAGTRRRNTALLAAGLH